MNFISQNPASIWDSLVGGVWHINLFCCCLGSSFFNWVYSFAKLEKFIDEKFYTSFLLFTNHVMRMVIYLHGSPK